MDPALAHVPPAPFTDGLGQRHQTDGSASEPLEVLTLRKDLTTVPAFEFGLRERVSRLAGFRHPSFGQVRGVSRLGTDASSLALVSDRVVGYRLSDVLAVADRNLIPLDIGAGLSMIRQLLDAVATLHDTMRDISHGAIALERIVITPDARLVLVEHVLGGALGSLQYSRDRYWKELRIALPATAGAPHFDRRADVTQIGAVALALIAGRPLGDGDYPDRVSELVSRIGAVSASGGFEPLPDVFRAWLSRALQLDPRQSFPSAIEAREDLERVLAETRYAAAPENLKAFLAQYGAQAARPVVAAHAPVAFPSAARVPATPPRRPMSSPSHSAPKSSPRIAAPAAVSAPAARPTSKNRRAPSRRFVAAAALFAAVASMGTLTAGTFLIPVEVPPAETGTLLVNSTPVGASVTIDGRPRGITPLVLAMLPGEHMVHVEGETGSRTIPVFVFADGHVGQFIQLPKAPPAAEEPVATESAAAPVSTPVESEPRAEAAPVVAPISSPKAPVSGWVSVTAPADVQLYENKRLLGSSRTARIAMAAGRHELDIVNEALGYQATRVVTVSPGKVSPIKLDWPNGSLSVNAQPWAEVSIDGARMGETPIGNVALPLGSHEVVFRHPELGEQRHRVTVTAAAPARLSVDLRKR